MATPGESLSVHVTLRTVGWRIFRPLATLIFLFFFGPPAMILSQVGMGHIAMIDAADLSLTLQGRSAKQRVYALESKLMPLLTAGFIAGVLSMILTTTMIGWLFRLPGIYAGCTLWTLTRSKG